MKGQKIVIFGGSGFLGRQVVQTLAREGALIRVAVRRPGLASYQKTIGEVGQISPVYCDVSDIETVKPVLKDADIAINMVGIFFENTSQKFDNSHIKGAKNISLCAQEYHLKRLIHISALGPKPSSKALYSKTKIKGEKSVISTFPEATILRPSLIFGPGEKFFTLYAKLAQLSPYLPIFGGGKTRFQPIFAGDVARAILCCLKDSSTRGHRYDLGGPDIFSFKELLKKIGDITGRQLRFIDFPFSAGYMMAKILGLFPTPLLTKDQIRLLKDHSVCSSDPNNKTLEDLGITPTPLDLKLPGLLKAFKPRF